MATEEILILKLITDLTQPAQSFGDLEKRLKLVKNTLKNTPDEGTAGFNKLAKEISGNLNIGLDAAGDKIREFTKLATKDVQEGSNKLKEYRKTLRTLTPAANSINAIRATVKKLTVDVDNLDRNTAEFASKSKELNTLNRQLIQIEQTTGRGGRNVGNYTKSFNAFGSTLRGVAASLGVGFGLAGLAQAGRKAFTVFSDFNQELATLRAVSKASKDELALLEGQALELGKTTQFTSNQLVKLQTSLARLGFKPEEITKMTEAVIQLSIATGEPLEAAGKTAGQTLNALGLSAQDTNRVVDVLTETFNSSALQLETYREGFKLFAPTAKGLNISLEETAGTLGLMADNFLEGSIATTSIATAFARLTDPAGKAAKAAEDLGISVFDQNERFVGMAQLLKNVEVGLEGQTEKQRLASIATIFGARAQKNFTTLLNATTEVQTENGTQILRGGAALEEYTKQLENSEGAAKRAAAIVGDTLNQDVLKLQSAIEGAAIEFGKLNEGGLREFIQFLTKAIPVLAENTGTLLRLVAGLALFTQRARLAGALTSVLNISSRLYSAAISLLAVKMNIAGVAVERLTIKQRLLNLATKANVIGAAIAVITLAVVAYNQYTKSVSASALAQKSFNDVQKEAASATAEEKNKLEQLLTIARDETETKELRIQAIQKLNEISDEYLGNLTLENLKTEEGTKLIDNYIKALDKKALAQAVANKKQELFNKEIEIESSSVNENIGFLDKLSLSTAKLLTGTESLSNVTETANKNRIESLRLLELERDAFDALIKTKIENGELSTNDLLGGISGVSNTPTTTTELDGKIDKEIRELERLQTVQKDAAAEIKNLIAEGKPYEDQLTKFNDATAKLTAITTEYNKVTKKAKEDIVNISGSLKDYNFQISELNKEQSALTINSAEYNQISQQIIILENQKANALLLSSTATEDYKNKILELNRANGESSADLGILQSGIERIKAVTDASSNGADEVLAIEKDIKDQLTNLNTQRTQERLNNIELEVSALEKKERDELELAKGNEELIYQIEQKYALLKGQLNSDSLALQIELGNEKLKRAKEIADKELEIETEKEKKKKEIQQAAFQVANELNGAIFEILENQAEKESERANAKIDADEEAALLSAENTGASEEQKEQIRQRFAKKREELEKEEAKKRKQRALIEAAINTALAVTKALPNVALSVLAGVLGAIQIATIASQKFQLGGLFDNKVRTQKFGKGAYLSKGAYHSSGGMPIINPHTGQKVAEIEKGEGILNRKIMQSKQVMRLEGTPYEIASKLNSHKGWGNAFPKRSIRAKISQKKYNRGGSYGVNRSVPKLARGAVFTSDITNKAILVAEDKETKQLMLTLIDETRNLRKSNEAGFIGIPSTAAEMIQAKQLVIDEQNAS